MAVKINLWDLLKLVNMDAFVKKAYYFHLKIIFKKASYISSTIPQSIQQYNQSKKRIFKKLVFPEPVFLNEGNVSQYNFYIKNSFDFPEVPFYYEIPNAILIGPEAVGLTDNGSVILDTVLNKKDLILKCSPRKINNHAKLTVEVNYGTVISLVNIYNNGFYANFYHWIVDCLFLLKAAEIYERKERKRPKILINKNPRQWQLETLELLGFGYEDLIFWINDKAKVDILIVPSIYRKETEKFAIFPTDILIWFQKKILSKIEHDDKGCKNIYISRKKCKYRNVINKKEFENLLNKHKFKKVVLEDLCVLEQIKLFIQAENIMGVHGAGLANIMYCTNKNIIELIGNSESNYDFSMYYKISSQLKNNYYVFFCPYFYSEEKAQFQNYDIIVNVEDLDFHLSSIIP